MRELKKLPACAAAIAAALIFAANASAADKATMLRPDKVATDSCGYEVENKMLCDGVREPIRWQEAWISTEWTESPRWAELSFTSEVPVRTVAIFWGVDEGAPAASRAYSIQAWQTNAATNAFVNILEVKNGKPAARSVHTFKPVTSKRFRVWQPVGGGIASRPNAMWIAEIELYEGEKPDREFGTPADLAEAERLRREVRDRTIGVFRRARGYRGPVGVIANFLGKQGWRVIQLDYLDERELRLCRAAVMCGPRALPNMDTLAEYVGNGGGLMFLNNSCGRGPGSAFPDIWEFTGMADSCALSLEDARHPITRGITNAMETAYGEYATMKAGRKGTALVRDAKGRDVAVAGAYGKGRAVAIGTFPGMSSEADLSKKKGVALNPGECELLANSVKWLTQDTKLREPWKLSGIKRPKTLYENVTDACGMTYGGYSKNVAMGDVNGDGRLEIFATQCKISTADPCFNLLYRNDGDWKFAEIGQKAGVNLPYGIGSVFGDVDNDGNMDLFVSWMPEMANKSNVPALFMGDGKCGFRNATREAGLGDMGQVSVCQLADVDNDGDLDLYVAGCGQENRMYRNNGKGAFQDVTTAMGLGDLGAKGETGYGGNMACGMADLDGDGYVDLAAFSKGVLYVRRNDGGVKFVDLPEYMGAGRERVSGGSLGLALGDYDNDGDLDIYVAGCNALLRNDGKFRFADVTKGSGLDIIERHKGAYGTELVDWNNDGLLDIFIACSFYEAFQNDGNGKFSDKTAAIGLDVCGVHGFNFGDLDNDGDLDFYATSWAKQPSALLKNTLDDGNALTIRVKGTRTNRSGVGAKVWVYDDGEGKARKLRGYREVRAGGGSMYSGAILDQHVGVPRTGKYTVEVLFPVSGQKVTLPGLTPPQIVTIAEP
ncbi:MAG: CRTAC1 family protein [Lentisphaerae bacterium]|nr:CRTAC1 family protein [Lentisphaerota bacterium]